MGAFVSTLVFQPPSMASPVPKYTWMQTRRGARVPVCVIRRSNPLCTILYSHGNAEDLGMIYDFLSGLSRALNANIVAYDYTGYGLGVWNKYNIVEDHISPSEENAYADIDAAYEYLKSDPVLCRVPLIIYGRSLGSGPSCYLAQRLEKENDELLQGLVLHAPFTSVYRVVLDFGVTLRGDMFPNSERLSDIWCPVFILHGTRDKIVPCSHGKTLFSKLNAKSRYAPFWAEGMGHNNIEADMTTEFVCRLQQFIDDTLDSPFSDVASISLQVQDYSDTSTMSFLESNIHCCS
eukprot:CAMPEP_0118674474 /NCGR_PEP_ID=MMETSP0800-20121206/907_1 /TAXON_ID=210618 ORGANISM="Striatella unipunctata, Strain CCMP2910" /NCGR_SAMPLE_ID=MMETSP0800 /ASSEMBLY_ACC=CAM_ASM_000638 /LENGTH=291 /DNA_ID=CAMNT_0006569671 /DNA_START=155 /DNA_END=1030 /DNA_ORIENTATION=+